MLNVLVAGEVNGYQSLVENQLVGMGYQCLMAFGCAQIVDLFVKYRPDIVLLDEVLLSGENYNLARDIKKMAPDGFVPVLLMVDTMSSENVERYFDAGCDDFIPKPTSPKMLRAKMTAFGRMKTMQNNLSMHRNQLRRQHDQLLAEQSIAKHVYDAITGRGSLDCGTIRYHMSSLALFNGDVLLASIRPNGNLMVLLGDFTGHGLPAALGAIPMASSFYNMVATGFSQVDIIRELNERLAKVLPRGFFCCAICVEMDFSGNKLNVWNGGLPTGVLLQKCDKGMVSLPSTHLPLGIETGTKFSVECQTVSYSDQDRLLLWTDGIYDVRNSANERFGPDRVQQIIEQHQVQGAQGIFDHLLMAVKDHLGDEYATEDLSLVEVLTKRPQADAGLMQQPISQKGPLDWQFQFDIKPPTFCSLDPIPMLMTLLSQVPGLGSKATSLFTVLSELYNNALDHGLLGLTSQEKAGGNGFSNYYVEREQRLQALTEGYVRFQLKLSTQAHSGRLEIVVEDSGPGFDHDNPEPGANHLLHGRGIDLVRQFSQSLSYEGRGNRAKAVYVWSLDT